MARKTKEEALRTRQLLIESAIQQFRPAGGDQYDPDGYR